MTDKWISDVSLAVTRRGLLTGGAAVVGGLAAGPLLFPGQALAAKTYQWGSASQGSSGYVIISTLANFAGKYTDDRHSAVSTSGGAENMALIGRGKLQFGQSTSTDWELATKGKPPFTEPVVAHQLLTYAFWMFPPIVLAASNIKSIDDLAGKRVHFGPAASSGGLVFKLLMQAHGVYDSQTPLHGSWGDAYEALKTRAVDCIPAITVAGRPAGVLRRLEASHPVRALEFPANTFSKANKVNPGLWAQTLSPTTWKTLKAPMQAPAMSGIVAVAPSVSADAGYKVTKAILEHEEEIRKTGPVLNFIGKKNAVSQLMPQFKVNAGAARYFKEIGVWREELQIAG